MPGGGNIFEPQNGCCNCWRFSASNAAPAPEHPGPDSNYASPGSGNGEWTLGARAAVAGSLRGSLRAELQLQGQQVEAGNSTSDNLQSANTYCPDPLDVQGPHAASCQWMKTAGDDCTQSDDNACRCRDYNSVQRRCAGCSVNPCQKRFCFDIIDLPDNNNCQWMYNEGDDCTSTDPNAEACRQANAHSCAPCPR
jgi:hypothetical protein